MLHRCTAASLAAITVLAGMAAADPDLDAPARDRWLVTALVGTDVGLDVAAGLQVEAPFRLRLGAMAGWIPELYAWGLKEYYIEVFDGRQPVGELLEETVENSFAARGLVGVRPFARRGLFVDVAYTFVYSSKDGLTASLIEAAGGQGLGEGREFERTFESTVRVHMLGAQLGWQWGLGPGWSLRASVGVSSIMKTSTSLEPSFTPQDPELNARIIDGAESALDDAGAGVWAPLASVFVGYTF